MKNNENLPGYQSNKPVCMNCGKAINRGDVNYLPNITNIKLLGRKKIPYTKDYYIYPYCEDCAPERLIDQSIKSDVVCPDSYDFSYSAWDIVSDFELESLIEIRSKVKEGAIRRIEEN